METLDIAHSHPHTARHIGRLRGPPDRPASRSEALPSTHRVDPTPHQPTLIGQIGRPQRDKVPAAPADVPGYSKLTSANGADRGCGTTEPGSVRGLGIKAQRLPCRRRTPQPIGERREDRISFGWCLPVLYSLSRSWCRPVRAADLPLREAASLEHRDDIAKITLRACVEDLLACADSLDNPAHLRKSHNHGALPVPLVARQSVRYYLSAPSLHQVIRSAPERGSRHGRIGLVRPGPSRRPHHHSSPCWFS